MAYFLAFVLFGKSTTRPPVKPALIDCCVISSSCRQLHKTFAQIISLYFILVNNYSKNNARNLEMFS